MLLLFIYFLSFFSGQNAAKLYYDTSEGRLGEGEGEAEEEGSSEDLIQEVVAQRLEDIGLVYPYVGTTFWVLFLSRSLSSDVEVDDVKEGGVYLKWVGSTPPKSVLQAVEAVSKDHCHDMLAKLPESTTSTLFLQSPASLCQDTSKIQQLLLPKDTPEWLVLLIPWESEVQVTAQLPHLNLHELLHPPSQRKRKREVKREKEREREKKKKRKGMRD